MKGNFGIKTNFISNEENNIQNCKNNKIKDILSKLDEKEKDEYLIYLFEKESEDDMEDNESEEEYLEEENSQIRIFGENFINNNKNN